MMYTEHDKAKRIISEVMGYFIETDVDDFSVAIHLGDECLILDIEAECEQEPDDFQSFLKDLNVPREIEIDEYYSQLLGSHANHLDYTLLGKSIDKADGQYENGKLTLKIVRTFV